MESFIWPDGTRRTDAPPATIDGKNVALYVITLPAIGPASVESGLLDAGYKLVKQANREDPTVLAAVRIVFPTP